MKFANLVASIAISTASTLSHASITLSCDVGAQGKAKLEVFNVEDRPDLFVYQIDLRMVPAANANGEQVHLQGLLSAKSDGKNILASGSVSSAADGMIINPELITLQGTSKSDGSLHLQLIDADRILQLGFGVAVTCN